MSRNEHWIFNPDDTVLKDFTWLTSQPHGTVATTLTQKPDTYWGPVTLGVGMGRNGKNAIRMQTRTPGTPPGVTDSVGGLLISPFANNGGSVQFAGGESEFILPRTKRANRIEFWVKWPNLFKATMSQNTELLHNVHFGTFLARPSGLNGVLSDIAREHGPMGDTVRPYEYANGWHFYHETVVRHDLVAGQWTRLVYNPMCSNIRQPPNGLDINPKDPGSPHGGYFDMMTYCYFDNTPTWYYNFTVDPTGDPEIPPPFDILIDSIRMYWVDEYLPVEIRFGASGDWFDGQEVEIAANPGTSDIPFRITNTTNATVTGILAPRLSTILGARIVEQPSGTPFDWASVSLNAGQTKHYWLRCTPSSFANVAYPQMAGITFEPSTEVAGYHLASDWGTWGRGRRNKLDGNVRVHPAHGVGGWDYDICSRNVSVMCNGGTNATYRPTSVGGARYRVPPTVTSQFQIPGHDPGGGGLTFAKIQSQSGRGTLTINSSGLATYTPPSAGWTGTCHFSYQINGASAKPSEFYGAWVDVNTAPRVPKTAGGKVMIGPGGGLILTE